MKRTIIRSTAACLAVSVTMHPLPSWSGWVDDWVQQKSSTSPSDYEGAKRGYYTGGSFSARWANNDDRLVTATLPKLKSGCGGIDMFLGGFSFLNVDYLVQKLQNILSAAPAAAFDIALKTLAPQVADTIKSLEAITDRLNSLQLNDCKAAKALAPCNTKNFTHYSLKLLLLIVTEDMGEDDHVKEKVLLGTGGHRSHSFFFGDVRQFECGDQDSPDRLHGIKWRQGSLSECQQAL